MTSRVARKPIPVPSGVEINLAGAGLKVKGKLGQLEMELSPLVKFEHNDGMIQVSPANDARKANQMAGTTRALVNNMVTGVSDGFECALEMVGVGYRAKAQGKSLNLSVGKSHPVDLQMPEGVSVETPSQTEIVLKGIDKQKVMQVARNIREERPPEPYKGKGIRYKGERVVLKEVKKK